MTAPTPEQQLELDAALAAEQQLERERLIQEALDAHADYLRAKKAYAQACAKLIPFRTDLSQVAA